MNFTKEEKKFLLQTARRTLEEYFKTGKELKFKIDNEKFLEKRGVFVTLYKNDQLRGCIGYIEPVEKLITAVINNAISAAVHDERFSSVTENELSDLEIEISVLTVPEKVSLEDIKEGDGVVLKKGIHKSTYLPQVWEEVPDKEVFLGSLCQKAGLTADCWISEDVEFLKYNVEVFSEKEIK